MKKKRNCYFKETKTTYIFKMKMKKKIYKMKNVEIFKGK